MNKLAGHAITDQDIISRILAGDKTACEILIRNTEALVMKIISDLVWPAEDRKDVVQDTYLKVFHKLGTFGFQSRLSTWIAQIAYNTAVNWLRKKKLVLPGDLEERKIADESLPADTRVMQRELSQVLQQQMKTLPVMYQLLLSLFHQHELSYAEIMHITGLPEGTLKNYLFRARKALKQQLLTTYPTRAL